jgi:hypothetical protein
MKRFRIISAAGNNDFGRAIELIMFISRHILTTLGLIPLIFCSVLKDSFQYEKKALAINEQVAYR